MVLVYCFPGAAITNYHKLGDLKQQIFIFSQFWRPDVPNQSVGRAVLPQKASGENLPLLLAALAAACVLGWGSLTSVLASVVTLFPPLLCVFSSVWFSLVSLCLAIVRIRVTAF